MAEYSNIAIVTVAAGQNVPFTEEANTGKPCIVHREGAGLVTLRGLTNQCRAKFKVSFGANIAIPTGGTVEAITAAIRLCGESFGSAITFAAHKKASAPGQGQRTVCHKWHLHE